MDALDVLTTALARQAPAAVAIPPGAASLLADELRAHRALLAARAERVDADTYYHAWRRRNAAVAASHEGA
ncbi:MAG: hypothetical protein MUF30_11830 [Burkholderiales bacterium]|jgi:hypothetical protein|nr:hypothetical protein [Burkholderiales bacterium]